MYILYVYTACPFRIQKVKALRLKLDFQSNLISILKKKLSLRVILFGFEKLYSRQAVAILVSARRKAEMTKSSSEPF